MVETAEPRESDDPPRSGRPISAPEATHPPRNRVPRDGSRLSSAGGSLQESGEAEGAAQPRIIVRSILKRCRAFTA